MIRADCKVAGVAQVAENIFVLSFTSKEIAGSIQPGQFVNLKIDCATDPLLRRPFSAYRVDGDRVEIIFNVVGKGTSVLRNKQPGHTIDVLGPLGVPFTVHNGQYETAILIGGGLGVAPFPILTTALKKAGKRILTFLGSRSASHLVENHLENIQVATDDGTKGYHGNVVDLTREAMNTRTLDGLKMFACGPTAMLRALASFAREQDIQCEVSLEGPMGCGFGICQGCPVELVGEDPKYALMCKDGPAFDVRRLAL
jgi:dihydroorotate dehydrogenase electron transfer subunit